MLFTETLEFDSTLFNKSIRWFTLPKFTTIWPIVSVHIVVPFDTDIRLKVGDLDVTDRFADLDLTSLKRERSMFTVGKDTNNPVFIDQAEPIYVRLSGTTEPTQGSGWLITSWINRKRKL